ncbi:amidase [Agrobacterium rubi]|uniref:Indoleacetamide hydrolase n=2 Tax=Agrobacterium rubi TaxID=28099 RepID=A0AAE7RFS8_9HYPH|nr:MULTISPECIES: amidase [Agrobacterium]MBN7807854.1 amidase [Agrobacterium rosae]NTE89814.1 amidase [Agrobacterium rubi]NTF05336.1 amidase [Agrobacterium rubi]NTF39780.1 amidase [Agrobacterium rubi]OCJ44909.1 glutamyl-tRNA amidotransferase [Agrobacterium rubi]
MSDTRSTDILDLDLCDIADHVAVGDVSALAVAQAAVSAAADIGRKTNAVIALEQTQALEKAEALDRLRSRNGPLGALHGVPLANKDMFYRKGFATGGGSSLRQDFMPGYTATVIERLDQAGAVTTARLNMAEFALNPTGHNVHHGDCKNPWNPDFCTGGSSSGSGAAVASRIVYGSLGSDTGGSIRMPASMCGVTGIKGTQGLVSRYGVMPLAYSVDCVGPIARTARDCARLLGVIAGEDPNDPTCAREPVPNYESFLNGDIRGLRIGYAAQLFGFQTDPELEAAVADALEVYKSRGAQVLAVSVPNTEALVTYAGLVQRSEMATIHAQWMRVAPAEYAKHVSSRIFAGYGIPATAYIEALSRRGGLLNEFCRLAFREVDVIATPALTMRVPTRIEADMDTGGEVAERIFGRVTENARLLNYLGLPAMSVPAGFDRRGLPIGMQLFGRPFGELMLLKTAEAFQRDTNWHRLKPPLVATDTNGSSIPRKEHA